jgi:ubiquinone/menaquinone biosynthesis C-methylase UbiE
MDDTQSSYDKVAQEYARRISDELQHKPLDRQLLERFARTVKGRVCDLGCGPGHVARYLYDAGADVIGIDLSPEMVRAAGALHPQIEFRQGDMQKLDLPDASLAGIAAFYSIIHIPREQVVDALRELYRVLQPGGILFLAFHRGDQVVHLEDWWGEAVNLDFAFFLPHEMAGYLGQAGFQVDEIIERAPYPDIEHQSQRVYIFAAKS